MKTTLSINQPFKDWVNHLKQDIRSAQIKAAVRVNSELLHLYWQLGAEIIERQKEMTWGSGFLEELSRELMAEFPDMKGFSYREIFLHPLGASSLYHLPMQGSELIRRKTVKQ